MVTAATNAAMLRMSRNTTTMSIVRPLLVVGGYKAIRNQVYAHDSLRIGLLEDHPCNYLRNRGRPFRPVELNRLAHSQVDRGVVDLLGVHEVRSQPDEAPSRHRREEAHLVEPVVDPHLRIVDAVVVLAQCGNERQCQETVGNGCAIRTFEPGPLDIDMDPLMVTGRVGESIDAVLIDSNPLRDAEFLTDGRNGVLDG